MEVFSAVAASVEAGDFAGDFAAREDFSGDGTDFAGDGTEADRPRVLFEGAALDDAASGSVVRGAFFARADDSDADLAIFVFVGEASFEMVASVVSADSFSPRGTFFVRPSIRGGVCFSPRGFEAPRFGRTLTRVLAVPEDGRCFFSATTFFFVEGCFSAVDGMAVPFFPFFVVPIVMLVVERRTRGWS